MKRWLVLLLSRFFGLIDVLFIVYVDFYFWNTLICWTISIPINPCRWFFIKYSNMRGRTLDVPKFANSKCYLKTYAFLHVTESITLRRVSNSLDYWKYSRRTFDIVPCFKYRLNFRNSNYRFDDRYKKMSVRKRINLSVRFICLSCTMTAECILNCKFVGVTTPAAASGDESKPFQSRKAGGRSTRMCILGRNIWGCRLSDGKLKEGVLKWVSVGKSFFNVKI